MYLQKDIRTHEVRTMNYMATIFLRIHLTQRIHLPPHTLFIHTIFHRQDEKKNYFSGIFFPLSLQCNGKIMISL